MRLKYKLKIFIGFAILLSGVCFYNDIIILPGIKKILQKFGVSKIPYGNVDEGKEEESNKQASL